MAGNTTSTELLFIMQDPQKCSKTLFYEDGNLIPSMRASLEICGTTPVPFGPGF
jgi:hypothetical protein